MVTQVYWKGSRKTARSWGFFLFPFFLLFPFFFLSPLVVGQAEPVVRRGTGIAGQQSRALAKSLVQWDGLGWEPRAWAISEWGPEAAPCPLPHTAHPSCTTAACLGKCNSLKLYAKMHNTLQC